MNRPQVSDDLCRELDHPDYHWAKQQFEKICYCAGTPNKNVGYFGSISFPGISDIDAIVFGTDEQIRAIESNFQALRRSSTRFAQLFWHGPVYIRDDIAAAAEQLHTFDGVKMLDGGNAPFPNRISNSQRELLHLIWFTFLQGVVAGICGQKKVSLRLLLLVYKNLEHSRRFFASRELKHDTEGMASHEYRGLAWSDPTFVSDGGAWDAFQVQFQNACIAADRYCTAGTDSISNSRRSSSMLVAGRTRFIRSRPHSSLLTFGRFSFIGANPRTYEIASSYLSSAPRPSNDLTTYLNLLDDSIRMYSDNGIPLSFITPFGITSAPSRRKRLLRLNRIFR